MLNDKYKTLAEDLEQRLPSDVYKQVSDLTVNAQLAEHTKTKMRHIQKFDRLRTKSTVSTDALDPQKDAKTDRWVMNLSDRQLSEPERDILKRGLNFAVTPTKLPVAELITCTEVACKQLNSEVSEALRLEAIRTIKHAKPPSSNISKAERLSIESLRKDRSIVILPADKGRCTVVMNSSTYESKAYDLLGDSVTYSKLEKDPTSGYKRRLISILKELKDTDAITIQQYRYLYPTTEDVPRFYGLPKIHKQSAPLRPIVSSIGSITSLWPTLSHPWLVSPHTTSRIAKTW